MSPSFRVQTLEPLPVTKGTIPVPSITTPQPHLSKAVSWYFDAGTGCQGTGNVPRDGIRTGEVRTETECYSYVYGGVHVSKPENRVRRHLETKTRAGMTPDLLLPDRSLFQTQPFSSVDPSLPLLCSRLGHKDSFSERLDPELRSKYL